MIVPGQFLGDGEIHFIDSFEFGRLGGHYAIQIMRRSVIAIHPKLNANFPITNCFMVNERIPDRIDALEALLPKCFGKGHPSDIPHGRVS
jgi:hypothetical protein